MVLAICLLIITLYLPTAFVSEQFVLPFPLTTCTADCPTNAFMLAGSEPAFLGEVEYLRDVLAVLAFTAAVSILALRIQRATPLMRPMLVPVLAMAIVRLLAVAGYQLAARNYPDAALTEVVGWMAGFGIPAMSIAFLVGLIYWRLVEATTLEQVTAGLRSDLGPEGLESLIAGSGIGGSVRILYRLPGPAGESDRWADGVGLTAQLPAPGSSQVVAKYGSGENKVAVVHEEMLQGQTKFLDAIASCAIASQEYERLSTALDSSLQEVADSRARISAAADEERRRIERDLHDGAQQQLVTLRIKLELIAEMIESDPERAAEQLRGAGTRLTDILDEVRVPGAGHLSAATRRCRARRGAGRGGAAVRGSDQGRLRRRRPLSARNRERRLLLLPGGAPERRQARRRRQVDRDPRARVRWAASLRGARRRRRLHTGGHRQRRRAHQYARSRRRPGRQAERDLVPGQPGTRVSRHRPGHARELSATGTPGAVARSPRVRVTSVGALSIGGAVSRGWRSNQRA